MKQRNFLSAFALLLLLCLLLSTIGCASGQGTTPASTKESGESTSPDDQLTESVNTEEITTESNSDTQDSESASESGGSSDETDKDETESEKESCTEESSTKEETTTELESLCSHKYENACSNECLICGKPKETPSTHAFSQFDTCYDIVCTKCGFVLEQEHDWKYHSSTATLISAGSLTMKCSKCYDTYSADVEKIDPAILGMPVVYISDFEDASIPLGKLQKSDGEIIVKYSFVSDSVSFDCISEIKVQGASSSGHPKKNYNVKFFTDDTLSKKLKVDLGWGKENKYCMKANYIDSSQSRNIIGAQLFAQVVACRASITEGLNSAPNYGLIDGFPILVYLNGEFHGLYTMNIPKDDWMFGMEGGEESREAMLMADAWTGSVSLRDPIGEGDLAQYGFEIEHCSTIDDSWVRESFNELINLLNCGDKDTIMTELANHLDIDAAIDNMIFTYFINTADNTAKNILWVTYDGRIWIPSMYDMDGSFGIYWNGTPIPVDSNDHNSTPRNTFPSINENGSMYIPGNKMYELLIKYYPEKVRARYVELKRSVFSFQNINNTFNAFFDKIPEVAYTSDFEKWTKIPYAEENRANMFVASKEQLLRLDNFFLKIGQ